MKLDVRMNQAARRFAVRAKQLPELADFEQLQGVSGAASATTSWVAVETDWSCIARATKESPGARMSPQMVNAPSYSYELIGPAVKVNGSLVSALAITKEMRVRVKARGALPERVFTIVDISNITGVQLKILATLND